MPAGFPSLLDVTAMDPTVIQSPSSALNASPSSAGESTSALKRSHSASAPDLLPPPVTAPGTPSKKTKKTTFIEPEPGSRFRPATPTGRSRGASHEKERVILSPAEEKFLFPAHLPPKYHFFDLFPFSLLVGLLTKRGKRLKGKKAARLRASMIHHAVSHNLPLEISLYLVSVVFTAIVPYAD